MLLDEFSSDKNFDSVLIMVHTQNKLAEGKFRQNFRVFCTLGSWVVIRKLSLHSNSVLLHKKETGILWRNYVDPKLNRRHATLGRHFMINTTLLYDLFIGPFDITQPSLKFFHHLQYIKRFLLSHKIYQMIQ